MIVFAIEEATVLANSIPTGRKWQRLLVVAAAAVLVASLLVVVVPPTPVSAAVSPGITERVSVTDKDAQVAGNWTSEGVNVALSGDGTQVAFNHSVAIDMNDGNVGDGDGDGDGDWGYDIYVRDRTRNTTVLISRNASGGAANGESNNPSLSWDGRYVAFTSTATDIPAPGVDAAPQADVFICDRDPDGDQIFDERESSGNLDYRYIWIGNSSVDANNIDWYTNTSPSISHDGATIAWRQEFDRQDGEPAETAVFVQKLAMDQLGRLGRVGTRYYLFAQDEGMASIAEVRLAAGGGQAAFVARIPSSPGGSAVYVFDVATGGYHQMDIEQDGAAVNGAKSGVSVSGDGRMVSFLRWIDIDGNNETSYDELRAFVMDRDPDGNGVFWPTGSVYSSGIVSKDPQGNLRHGNAPTLAASGRYIAFQTNEPNMHNGIDQVELNDTGAVTQTLIGTIVLRDVWRDREDVAQGFPVQPAELISPALPNKDNLCGAYEMKPGDVCEGDAPSFGSPAVSADGRVVAFWSAASDLVPNDTNSNDSSDGLDVFVRELQPTISVDTDADDVGAVRIGSSRTFTFDVSHTGFGPVYVDDVRFEGPDADEFTITATNCDGATLHHRHPLASQVNCRVVATFTPKTDGSHGALLETRHVTLRFDTRRSEPVTAPLAIEIGQPVNGRQAVTLDPSVAAPGRATVVSGSGFAGEFPVNVQLADTPDSESLTVVTDRYGEFTLQLPIGKSVMPGRWPVMVSVADTDIEARKSLLVVQGTQQPPNYNTRR